MASGGRFVSRTRHTFRRFSSIPEATTTGRAAHCFASRLLNGRDAGGSRSATSWCVFRFRVTSACTNVWRLHGVKARRVWSPTPRRGSGPTRPSFGSPFSDNAAEGGRSAQEWTPATSPGARRWVHGLLNRSRGKTAWIAPRSARFGELHPPLPARILIARRLTLKGGSDVPAGRPCAAASRPG